MVPARRSVSVVLGMAVCLFVSVYHTLLDFQRVDRLASPLPPYATEAEKAERQRVADESYNRVKQNLLLTTAGLCGSGTVAAFFVGGGGSHSHTLFKPYEKHTHPNVPHSVQCSAVQHFYLFHRGYVRILVYSCALRRVV